MPKTGKLRAEKNDYLLMVKFFLDKKFQKSLGDLIKKYGSRSFPFRRQNNIFFAAVLKLDKSDKKRIREIEEKNILRMNDAVEITRNFFRALNEKEKSEFVNDIQFFLEQNDLDEIWFNTVYYMVVAFYIQAPSSSFMISQDSHRKVLNLQIGRYSTLTDIQNAWKIIEGEKRRIFGKVTDIHISAKIQKQILQNFKLGQLRGEKVQSEVDKESYRKTGLDVMADIFPDWSTEKIDKERLKNLKQIKRRLLKRGR